jgi:hypothetical protein
MRCRNSNGTGDEIWDDRWKGPSVPAFLRDKVRNPSTFF